MLEGKFRWNPRGHESRPLLIPVSGWSLPFLFRVWPNRVLICEMSEFISGMTTGTQAGSRLSFLAFMGSPLITRMGDRPAFENEGLVVISSPFFPHRLSKGYANPFMVLSKRLTALPLKILAIWWKSCATQRKSSSQLNFMVAIRKSKFFRVWK